MKKIFSADKITYETNFEEQYYMVGFSDNGDEPNQYVILQRAINFDKQDVGLGMNSYYFEFSDQSNSGYGICQNIIVDEGKIIFDLKSNSIKNIETIEIFFELKIIEDWSIFKDTFSKIIADM